MTDQWFQLARDFKTKLQDTEYSDDHSPVLWSGDPFLTISISDWDRISLIDRTAITSIAASNNFFPIDPP